MSLQAHWNQVLLKRYFIEFIQPVTDHKFKGTEGHKGPRVLTVSRLLRKGRQRSSMGSLCWTPAGTWKF